MQLYTISWAAQSLKTLWETVSFVAGEDARDKTSYDSIIYERLIFCHCYMNCSLHVFTSPSGKGNWKKGKEAICIMCCRPPPAMTCVAFFRLSMRVYTMCWIVLHGAVGPSVRFVHDALKHNNNNNNNIIIIIIYLKTETAYWTYIFCVCIHSAVTCIFICSR